MLAAAIAGHFVYQMYEGHQRALLRAERATQSARDVLVEHTARTFEAVDRALQSVAEVRAGVVAGTVRDPGAVHGLLKATHGASPVLFALGWTNAGGDRLYSSTLRDPPPLNIADQEHFRVHAERDDVGLFVSQPMRSRIDDTWILAVSRRLNGANGEFAGIVNGALRLDYFTRFFAALDLGDERTVALLRRDGVVLAREPFVEAALGRPIAGGPLSASGMVRPAGTLHVADPGGGSPQILSYGVIPGLPLAAAASMSRANALADHFREVRQQAPRVGLMLAGLILGAWSLQRHLQRRETAEHEQALAAAVVQNSGDAIFYRDLEGTIRSWNAGAARIFGFTEAEIVGQSYLRLIPEDRLAEGHQFQAELDAGRRINDFETFRQHRDGSLVEVSLTLSPVLDRNGAIIGVSTIARDISERKHAEQALGEAQQALHAITANVPGVVYRRVQHPDGTISVPYFSNGLRDIAGISPEEGVADPAVVRNAVLPEDLEGLNRAFQESADLGAPWSHEWRLRHRDGTQRWARGAANAPRRLHNGDMVWDVVVMDVTALKAAEAALKASEARATQAQALLRDAVENLNDGFVLYDAEDRLVMMNRVARGWDPVFAARVEPGMSLEAVLRLAVGTGRVSLAGKDPESLVQERLRMHRQHYGQTVEREIGGRWYQVREHPTRDGGVVIVRTDITELKSREEQLVSARAEAERARARLTDAIESLSEGFLLWDSDDRLVMFNGAARTIHSDRGASLIPGAGFEDIMAGRVRAGLIEQAKGREEQYIHERVVRHRNPTGEALVQQFADGRWVSVREHRTREGGVVSIRTDITEVKHREAELLAARTEAEQARSRLVDAIESLEDGFLLWGPDDRLVLCNTAVARTNPHPRAVPVPGESYREVLERRLGHGLVVEAKGREAEFIAERVARRRSPPAEPFETEYAPGRWVSIRERRTRDGGLVVIRSDVTERRHREADLLAARAEADAANQAKSEFLSRMSHELRTPLNAIIGFAQMLELDRPRTLTPDQHEFARFISNGGQHLLGLVNDVLDFSRIESGTIKLNVERVAIAASLDDVRHTMVPMAEKAGVTLEIVPPESLPEMRADELRLRQVLINLVSNAIKYNRPGGSVRLSAGRHGDRVRFEIADTGVGIALEHHTELFQPFQRLGAERSAVEGTGIGLAICKRLVEAMRGSIGFNSDLGKGSTFWVELPAAAGPVEVTDVAGSALTAAAPRAMAGGYTLLYVEDNPANLRLMEHLMSTLPDVAMLSAPTPQLGLDLAAAHRPDIIVLDLNLPGMSGYEMLAKLKGMRELRNVPIMALTAAALPKDIERGLAAGFFRYLTKPIDVKVFLGAVDEALAHARQPAAAAG